MTGRIWRLKYVGKDAPVVTHKLDSAEWAQDDYAISASARRIISFGRRRWMS